MAAAYDRHAVPLTERFWQVLVPPAARTLVWLGICLVGASLATACAVRSPVETPVVGAPGRTFPASAPPQLPGGYGPGLYVVGRDIQPGTYRTRTVQPADPCYWARLRGFAGTDTDVIVNRVVFGPAVVTISPSEQGFETDSCGLWTTDLSRLSTSTTSVSNGTWIVGVDIEPGRYQPVGPRFDVAPFNCYWARLGGFSGLEGLDEGRPEGATVVTILPTDRGFESGWCGTWQPAP